MKFKNRTDAGKQLAERLEVTDAEHTVVLRCRGVESL